MEFPSPEADMAERLPPSVTDDLLREIIGAAPRCPHCGTSTADGRDHGRLYENGPIECLFDGRKLTYVDALRAMLAAEAEPRYSPYWDTGPRKPPSLPSGCYRADAGFTVHIRGACQCRR